MARMNGNLDRVQAPGVDPSPLPQQRLVEGEGEVQVG